MTNKELQQQIEQLEQQIKDLKIKLEKKAKKKPYKVKVPEDLEKYYRADSYGNIDLVEEVAFAWDYAKLYLRGLSFKTEEQAEQYDKERVLLFKLHKWAEEHNGGWTPDWEQSDDKFYIYYFHNKESFCVGSDWNCNTFKKLPYFKSEEIAKQFIEEFGEEIKEVLY